MKKWIKTTCVKTVKTMAQTAFATLVTVTVLSEVDWMIVGSTAALSGITCILMNIGNIELESEEKNV